MSFRFSFAFLVFVTAGCRANAPTVGPTAVMTPTREPVIAPENTREVMSKQPPDALIARDASICRVGPDVYASTNVGAMFRCRWTRVSASLLSGQVTPPIHCVHAPIGHTRAFAVDGKGQDPFEMRLKAAADLLEQLVADRALLADIAEADRNRL